MPAATRNSIRRAHKILALVVGLQFLFWTASGLFFTIIPIEKIRGEHLVHASLPGRIDVSASLAAPEGFANGAQEINLKPSPFGPVYEVRSQAGYAVYDAQSSAPLTPWNEVRATEIANAFWQGEGELRDIRLIDTPPREAGASRPMWRAEFQGADTAILWIDPDRLIKPRVRTTNWRIFDVLWRFHIMDVTGDDRFDSWWLRIAAFLGVVTILFGVALLVDRARSGRLLK